MFDRKYNSCIDYNRSPSCEWTSKARKSSFDTITKFSDPKREEWFKFLDSVQLYLNSTLQRNINTTPSHLLFGTHMRMREDPQIRELLEKEWIDDFQNSRNDLRK